MNSHSWFEASAQEPETEQKGLLRGFWDGAAAWRWPFLFVALPTLLVAGYYYLVAADQYESEAHFIVSSNNSTGFSTGGLGSLFGISGMSGSQGQVSAVTDYLESHAAVAALRKEVDLVAMFRRPEADAVSRLGSETPTPEELVKYFQGMVKVHNDRDNGITTLTVHAFRPEDAQVIANRLLALGEAQVNRMNERRYRDAVSAAHKQVALAEARVSQIQSRMTAFRQSVQDINPEVTGEAQIGLVSNLKAQLAGAQASLASMGGVISPSSPQYIATQRQIRALEGQITAQSGELTGGSPKAVASNLGDYEDLRVQQDFAGKSYTAAAASLISAQQEATRQQLYVDRVVEANLAVKSLFPQRARIVLITFLALCVAYGIGWLILAGVREHAA